MKSDVVGRSTRDEHWDCSRLLATMWPSTTISIKLQYSPSHKISLTGIEWKSRKVIGMISLSTTIPQGATMKRYLHYLPTFVIAIAIALMLLHGPIPQLEHWHEFADDSFWAGIPHAANVLSNLGFASVAVWGALRLWPQRNHPAVQAGWVGYSVFLSALLLTSVRSTSKRFRSLGSVWVISRLKLINRSTMSDGAAWTGVGENSR